MRRVGSQRVAKGCVFLGKWFFALKRLGFDRGVEIPTLREKEIGQNEALRLRTILEPIEQALERGVRFFPLGRVVIFELQTS